MANWFIVQNGKEKGPFSSSRLKELADEGLVEPETAVRREDQANPVEAGKVKGLFDAPASAPAPARVRAEPAPAAAPAPAPGEEPLIHTTADEGRRSKAGKRKARRRGGGYDEDSFYDDGPSGDLSRRRGPKRGGGATAPMLIVGGALMMVAMGLPWFSISQTKPKDIQEAMKVGQDMGMYMMKNLEFYFTAYNVKSLTDIQKLDAEERDIKAGETRTLRFWGPRFGVAITGLIFGVIILVCGILPGVVTPLRNLAWIFYFTAMALGLTILIWAMVWYFTIPGKDFPPLMSQGASIGPYIELAASTLVFTFGLIGGIGGVMAFAGGGGGGQRGGRGGDRRGSRGGGRRRGGGGRRDREEGPIDF